MEEGDVYSPGIWRNIMSTNHTINFDILHGLPQAGVYVLESMSYTLKKIQYYNRSVGILCQSENGPCPLLAICNVLLLQVGTCNII